MPAAQDSPKRLPIIARMGIVVLLVAAVLVFGVAGFWITRSPHDADIPADEPFSGPSFTAVLVVLGAMGIGASAVLYVIALSTNCFVRDLSRPCFERFKTRVYMCQIMVPLPAIIGLGLLVCIPVYPRLISAGLEPPMALIGPIIGTLALAQIPLFWIQLWAPVEKSLILGRMRAMGISACDLSQGWPIGISDPGQSTLKKLGLAEDDIGMLWITREALIYLGDMQLFEIRPEQLRTIGQKADAANTSALAGTAHVILTYVRPEQQERRVRLHIEGIRTLGGKARIMDKLAADLRRWQQGDLSVCVPGPVYSQATMTVAD